MPVALLALFADSMSSWWEDEEEQLPDVVIDNGTGVIKARIVIAAPSVGGLGSDILTSSVLAGGNSGSASAQGSSFRLLVVIRSTVSHCPRRRPSDPASAN